jgi:hypothetical protein
VAPALYCTIDQSQNSLSFLSLLGQVGAGEAKLFFLGPTQLSEIGEEERGKQIAAKLATQDLYRRIWST